MSSDRELLEFAAKAVGIELKPHPNNKTNPRFMFIGGGGNWNPLDDDAQALRLAVKLNIRFAGEWGGNAVALFGAQEFHETTGADPTAATRRAIVRAAAEIGRAML